MDNVGMETAKFYWTVVVGVAGAVWILVQFARDRIAQSIARTNAAVNRLFAIDQLVINSPDMQRYLSETAKLGENYFRDEARLKEDIFYKAKTLVYMHLNTFDEILSLSSEKPAWANFLGAGRMIESLDWEQYIRIKLRHPLYRSILNHEKEIFGEALRTYWATHRPHIEAAAIDPFVW